ncbi:NAD(P)/FAD-dependent oxidoreductase [Polycladidibacter hongkongensis]|uniref:NAD(P)/FAD-dependent oxidoreductase n=1 Tax=Polycladidibacter hongkongensis TaxID=1647556 RepID=UPI000833CE82|nr:FAD-binding oxidoreductase [Pseudovibrio hongkongensis]
MTQPQRGRRVVIAGGAVMGSATAYFLANHPDFSGEIIVIEKDPSYQLCASARSAASIRQQFSSAINISISQFSIAFLRDIGKHLAVSGDAPHIDLVEGGYLFLASKAGAQQLNQNHQLQRSFGADITCYSRAQLAQRYPWLNTDGIEAGCYGTSGEGWFDGYGLMQAFRRKARSLGVRYVQGVVEGLKKNECGWLVQLEGGEQLQTEIFVNTAGASGGAALCRSAGLDLPITSQKRMIFPFECKEEIRNLPLLVDPSGFYVRPEGKSYICGCAPAANKDPECFDFAVEHDFFMEELWPRLAHRIPAFESLRPGLAWAGHYDMNGFDQNAFVGPVPQLEGFYLALGFSGHGLQQAPAVGRGLAEHIATGTYQSLDLTPLSIERFWNGTPLLEKNVV